MKTRIMAEVIPAATVIQMAKKYGYDERKDTSPNDYVEPEMYEVSTEFKTLEKAVAYCVEHIKSGQSWYGAEYVREYERREDPYIHGRMEWIRAKYWIVSHEGIDEERDCEEEEERE